MFFLKSILKHIKSKRFWSGVLDGMASPFLIWGELFTPPRIYRERRDKLYEQYDINQALKSDWEKVGQDMWKAIRQVEGEIEHKRSH